LSSIAVALATAQSSALHRKICSAQSATIFNCRSNRYKALCAVVHEKRITVFMMR